MTDIWDSLKVISLWHIFSSSIALVNPWILFRSLHHFMYIHEMPSKCCCSNPIATQLMRTVQHAHKWQLALISQPASRLHGTPLPRSYPCWERIHSQSKRDSRFYISNNLRCITSSYLQCKHCLLIFKQALKACCNGWQTKLESKKQENELLLFFNSQYET